MGNKLFTSKKIPNNENNLPLSIGDDIWTDIILLLDIKTFIEFPFVCKKFAFICFKKEKKKLFLHFDQKLLKLVDTDYMKESKIDIQQIKKNGIFFQLSDFFDFHHIIANFSIKEDCPEPSEEPSSWPKYSSITSPQYKYILKAIIHHSDLSIEDEKKIFKNQDFLVYHPRKDIKVQIWNYFRNKYRNECEQLKTAAIVIRLINIEDEISNSYNINSMSDKVKQYRSNLLPKTRVCFLFYNYTNCSDHNVYLQNAKKIIQEVNGKKGEEINFFFYVYDILPKINDYIFLSDAILEKIQNIIKKLTIFYYCHPSPKLLSTYQMLSKQGDFDWFEMKQQANFLKKKN